MKDYRYQNEDSSLTMQSVLRFLRVLGAGLGMIVIVVGLISATRVFTLVYDALQDPEGVSQRVEELAVAMGGEDLDVVVEGVSAPGARVLAVITLGGMVIVLSWLSLGLIKAGAKTMYWTLTDREAVNRVLERAFGPTRKPGGTPPPAPQMSSREPHPH